MDDSSEFERELLARIREIAALSDDLAIEQVAEFVNELRFGADWDREHARNMLASVRAQAAHMTAVLEQRIPLEHWWDGRDFMDRVQRLGARWSPEIRQQFAGDIAEVRQLAEPVAKAAAIYGAVTLLESAQAEHISSTQVADRILREIDIAAQFLKSTEPSENHLSMIRQARERVARYRWQKKINEAEVVEAGGNVKKAQRLRAEANVMLRQDWVRIFPGESAPET